MQPQNDRGSRSSSGVSLEHPRSWVYSPRKVSAMRFSMRSRGRRRVQQNLLDFRAYRSRMQVTSSNSFGSKASYCGARLSRSPAAWSTCTRGYVSDFWASGSSASLNESVAGGLKDVEEYQELIKNITSSRGKVLRRLAYETFLRFFLGTTTRPEWTDVYHSLRLT